ncbi:hypothetical protein MNV49_007284 [Pseudohyphozyma bogoriensis]|nr:hypothetical protein MNV49_007284 [Pseudohyphozyma bogoriensis]
MSSHQGAPGSYGAFRVHSREGLVAAHPLHSSGGRGPSPLAAHSRAASPPSRLAPRDTPTLGAPLSNHFIRLVRHEFKAVARLHGPFMAERIGTAQAIRNALNNATITIGPATSVGTDGPSEVSFQEWEMWCETWKAWGPKMPATRLPFLEVGFQDVVSRVLDSVDQNTLLELEISSAERRWSDKFFARMDQNLAARLEHLTRLSLTVPYGSASFVRPQGCVGSSAVLSYQGQCFPFLVARKAAHQDAASLFYSLLHFVDTSTIVGLDLAIEEATEAHNVVDLMKSCPHLKSLKYSGRLLPSVFLDKPWVTAAKVSLESLLFGPKHDARAEYQEETPVLQVLKCLKPEALRELDVQTGHGPRSECCRRIGDYAHQQFMNLQECLLD